MDENKAFVICMVPGEGEITRSEFEEVKKAIGRLWISLWSFRRKVTIANEEWDKIITGSLSKFEKLIEEKEKEELEKETKDQPSRSREICKEEVKEIVDGIAHLVYSLPKGDCPGSKEIMGVITKSLSMSLKE